MLIKINVTFFCHIPDEWSMEDKILFEQAYSSHGKSFKRIQQIVSETPFCLRWCYTGWILMTRFNATMLSYKSSWCNMACWTIFNTTFCCGNMLQQYEIYSNCCNIVSLMLFPNPRHWYLMQHCTRMHHTEVVDSMRNVVLKKSSHVTYRYHYNVVLKVFSCHWLKVTIKNRC